MEKRKGRLWPPSGEGWLWVAGLICVILLLVRSYIVPEPEMPLTTVEPSPTLIVTPRPTQMARATIARPTPTLLPPTAAPAPTATFTSVAHVVQAGEVPLAIAARYGVDVEALLAANDIADPTTLQIGQELLIPVTVTATPRPAAATPAVSATLTPALVFYTVVPGDTLLAIALAHDSSVEAITAVNRLDDPRRLQIGQKLLIPPADGSMPDPILWAPTTIHEVKAGDTLLAVAREYGSTVEDILAANPELEPTALQIGQPVTIPLTRQKTSAVAKNSAPAVPTLSAEALASLRAASPQLVRLEQAMVTAVNAERQAKKLPAYIVDEQLALVAWSRAQDMVGRGYLGHTTPEGETIRDQMRAQGLATGQVGENLYLSVKPASQAVAGAVAWFMSDRPHRENILHQRYNRIGVGVAQDKSGWYTFVLIFSRN